MDLVGAISNLQIAKTFSEVQLKVARKLLDNQQLQGSAAVELIQAAGNGGSQAGDAVATQAAGLGGLLDVSS